jgi:hypothetical protein
MRRERSNTPMNATAVIFSHTFCSPREVRQVLRTSRNATYNAIKSGDIQHTKIGGVIKVPVAWLRAAAAGIPRAT